MFPLNKEPRTHLEPNSQLELKDSAININSKQFEQVCKSIQCIKMAAWVCFT